MSDARTHSVERGQLKSTLMFPLRDGFTRELNISGTHLVAALTIVFCVGGPLVWAFMKYWLFAP